MQFFVIIKSLLLFDINIFINKNRINVFFNKISFISRCLFSSNFSIIVDNKDIPFLDTLYCSL